MRAAMTALVAFALAACAAPGPRPVVLNEDECGFCRMEVADARFAAEAITRTGRIHVFDSVECLAGYVRGAEDGAIATVWVTDFERPGTFVAAAEAGYLAGSELRGPMGSAVAFATAEAARASQARLGGRVVTWDAVLADTSAHGHGGH
jgi:copper chaperone NosL